MLHVVTRSLQLHPSGGKRVEGVVKISSAYRLLPLPLPGEGEGKEGGRRGE